MGRVPAPKGLVIAAGGSGSHARVLLDACQAAGIAVRGYVALHAAVRMPGLELLGDARRLDQPDFLAAFAVLPGLGDIDARRALSEGVLAAGGSLGTLVHPSSIVSRSALLGAGSVVLAMAVVGPDSRVGCFCIVNTAASVDHDNLLEDGVNLCPGVRLAGRVTCRADAFLGTGAIVIPGITIGRKAIVGAGATVIRDVPDSVTVVGCPARQV